jgi:Xaa-Pro aminopeptidase
MAASDKEMARRIRAVREAMKGSGLGALIVFSTVVLGEKAAVRYLSNYRLLTRKDYMVVPLEGEPALVVATLNHQKGQLRLHGYKTSDGTPRRKE